MNTKQQKVGDLAVDGLVPGAAAGLVMIAFLVISGLLSGVRVTQMLGNFSLAGDSPVLGLVTHLAVSCVYGLLFSLLTGWLGDRRFILAGGLLYGLVLFAIGNSLVIPVMVEPLAEIGGASLLIAHLLFGLTLGWLFARRA